jgi:hypothetical protein
MGFKSPSTRVLVGGTELGLMVSVFENCNAWPARSRYHNSNVQPMKVNIKYTMTGRGIVSGSPSLLSGMPKRVPIATGDTGLGQSVQSSPLLVLRLNTWRILIGDFRLFLPPPVRPAVFFGSLLHSPDFLLLLKGIKSLSIFVVYQPFPFKTFLQQPQKICDLFYTEKINKLSEQTPERSCKVSQMQSSTRGLGAINEGS